MRRTRKRRSENPVLHMRCTGCGSTAIEKVSDRVLRCCSCGLKGSKDGTKIVRAADTSHAGPDWDHQGFGGYRRRPIRYD